MVAGLVLPGAALAASSSTDSIALCHSSSQQISRVKPGPYDYGQQGVVDVESKFDGETIHMGFVRPKVPAGKRSR